MALAAPTIDISAFGNMAAENQQRSSGLMNSAWMKLNAMNNAQAPQAAPQGAAAMQGGMGQALASYGQPPVANSGQAPAQAINGTPFEGATPDLRELLAKTLQAEAGGEGYDGMVAAGSVIMNRVNGGGYGEGLRGVIMRPGQFSAWNGVTGYAGGEGAIDMDQIRPTADTYRATDNLLSGQYQDRTGGATHYYNPNVANPKWGQQRAGGNWTTIGNHLFGFADAGRATPRPQQPSAPSAPPPQPQNVFQQPFVNSSPWLSFGQPVS